MEVIRQEQSGDIEAIHEIHRASFPNDGEARLVDALRAAGRLTISLVALEDGAIVGHVAFSPITIEGMDRSLGLGLGPVAVLPDHRQKGTAERLIREGLARSAHTHDFVVVLGSPTYYRRFGFEPARQWRLEGEYSGDDAFQALELRHGSIPMEGGRVRYAPEFAVLEG
jgi:putative acetyltransferase